MNKTYILAGAAAALALVGCGASAQTNDDAGHKGKRGGHGMMMMADANKDGNITRAEATAAATAHFTKMDFNKDGKLDQTDRDAMREQRQAARFDKMDANDDGSISKDEFGNRGDDDRMAGERGDGQRDGKRWGGKRGGKGGPEGRGGMDMMAKADTNGDKAVSAAEFQTASLARFDKMDGNKDGTVTKAEMDAAHAAMKAERKAQRAAQPAAAAPQNNKAN